MRADYEVLRVPTLIAGRFWSKIGLKRHIFRNLNLSGLYDRVYAGIRSPNLLNMGIFFSTDEKLLNLIDLKLHPLPEVKFDLCA